ncbi:hypothetical protein F4678DRAFT_464361 [Xylaria arbuscula]|nr:hypothetical protein F4678DRAFT_464361 [Xylaria arbuscula]
MYAKILAILAAAATSTSAAVLAHGLETRSATYSTTNGSWIANPYEQVFVIEPAFSLTTPDDYLPSAPGFDVWCVSWCDSGDPYHNCEWISAQPEGSTVSSTCDSDTGEVLVSHTWTSGSSTGSGNSAAVQAYDWNAPLSDISLTFNLN